MDLYAVPVRGNKTAKTVIRAAGGKIRPSLAPEDELHVEIPSLDETAMKTIVANMGKLKFQRLVNGKRTDVATPRVRAMVGVVRQNKGRAASVIATAAAVGGALYYWL